MLAHIRPSRRGLAGTPAPSKQAVLVHKEAYFVHVVFGETETLAAMAAFNLDTPTKETDAATGSGGSDASDVRAHAQAAPAPRQRRAPPRVVWSPVPPFRRVSARICST